jgi:beta-galactosidase
MKSALGYFEALSEMGVNVAFKAIEEFDFGKEDYKGSTIILAHQISVPDSCVSLLENFVRKGGKLIVDGLTAFFDENMQNTMKTGFPLSRLFGGNISEFKLAGNLFNVKLSDCILPAHLWRGFINAGTGVAEASFENEPVAIRNRFGNGEVLWIPSLIGLGSRLSGDYSSLIRFLNLEASGSLEKVEVRFKNPKKLVIMKTLISGSSLITVVINKSAEKVKAELDFRGVKMNPELIYSDKNGIIKRNALFIEPEETMVINWGHPYSPM